MQLISILIPVLNEQNNLYIIKEDLENSTKNLRSKYHFEFIILDNASEDNTGSISKKICSDSLEWKYIRYSRNFGYHNSLSGGLDYAKGDAVIFFQGDGQDPAEKIPEIVKKWEDGYDVVYGILKKRSDNFYFKTLLAKFFYTIFSFSSEISIPKSATDFRLIDRKIIDNIKNLKEKNRYVRGLTHWVGFKQTYFIYDRKKRIADKSKANFLFSLNFGIDAIVSFSALPLHLMLWAGVIVILISILLILFFFIIYFLEPSWVSNKPPAGITSILILTLVSLGLNTFFTGLLGLYVGKIYKETQNRPLYIIDEKINF
tara:strand:- start:184 stop:1131 length:948 start_codon:yes stop_codon:yes gene_type:complete